MDLRRVVEIDPGRCLKELVKGRRFLALMLLLGILAGAATAAFIVDDRDTYDAEASVYSISYGSYTESEKGISAIRTYSEIIKSYKVAERAALLLGDGSVTKESIYDMIRVDDRVIEGTTYVYENMSSVINIHAEYEDRDTAVRVVNAVADAFVMEVNSVSETDATQVLDYAYDAVVAYDASKQQILAVAAGGLAGFFLGCLILLYRVVFSKQIVTVKDATLYGQLPIIGAIPKF